MGTQNFEQIYTDLEFSAFEMPNSLIDTIERPYEGQPPIRGFIALSGNL